MSTPPPPPPPRSATLPTLHLLCMLPKYGRAFTSAMTTHFPAHQANSLSSVTIHHCALKFLPSDLRFDAVVSPANSYARLDGAFDDALARAYGPANDYDWITRKAQKVLYAKHRGFAPPGTCTVVRLDHEGEEEDGEEVTNPWGSEYLLLCPTMRIPQTVEWDREVVYECVWSMLCAVENHNLGVEKGEVEGKRIESVLMTPLATGVGRLSAERWAEQCVLAMKHWVEAGERPELWGSLDWGTILERFEETKGTYADEV